MTKIAIVGSAPSSRGRAPFEDKGWEIWACSPSNMRVLPRIDVWFELHPLDYMSGIGAPGYIEWVKSLPKVYAQEAFHGNVEAYPKEDMLAKFGVYFFTSSVAWMLALAITKKPEAIGLWGVDMAATEEYAAQRPGCHHFIQIAKQQGIEIKVPIESDLLEPPPLYGYMMANPMWRKLYVRRKELQGRLAKAKAQREDVVREEIFLEGGLDDLDYMMKIWGGR